MNLHEYLSVAPEIAEAIAQGKPVVALESTILSHGMPYPENVEFAHKVEKIVREEGAIPATTAIIGGKLKVGLNDEELLTMCKAENVGKVSRRDVAVYLATGQTGATTVATTMIIASLAGIRFFATGSQYDDRTVTWLSSDVAVASVENGTVTAQAPGMAIITCRAASGVTVTCTVTVTQPSASLTLDRNTLTMQS